MEKWQGRNGRKHACWSKRGATLAILYDRHAIAMTGSSQSSTEWTVRVRLRGSFPVTLSPRRSRWCSLLAQPPDEPGLCSRSQP